MTVIRLQRCIKASHLVGKLSVYLGERETQECHPGCTEASLDFGWLSDWDLGAVYSEWVDKIRDWVSNVNR